MICAGFRLIAGVFAVVMAVGQTPMVSGRRGGPIFTLQPQGTGARGGKIWVSSSLAGLLIEGEVAGPKPDWPTTRLGMFSKDHVEVWLAAAPKVDLPAIGWGNQFGETDLGSEKECAGTDANPQVSNVAGCKAWYRKQVQYREQFKRLFVRQWVLAGKTAGNLAANVVEAYAQPAMQNIQANFVDYAPNAIAPRLNDGVTMEVLDAGAGHSGYGFQIRIPYSAFPPVETLRVRDLWLMVDVFSAAPEGKKMGSYSTTAAQRKWGDPSTFNHVEVEQPLLLKLSPCGYLLAQEDLYGKEQPTYVYPLAAGAKEGESVVIDRVISVVNPAGGYAYDPAGASPAAEVRRVFWKPTGDGGFVCGPKLAYAKGAVSVISENVVNEEGFDTKALADGWMLVKTGPRAEYTPFGSGQCGACPRAQLQIYAISPGGGIESALDIYEIIGEDSTAADFRLSPGWARATYYRETEDGTAAAAGYWVATSYCLNGHIYKECGQEKNAKPPEPPVVKELRSP